MDNDAFKRLSVIFKDGSGILFRPEMGSNHAIFMTVYHNYKNPPKVGDYTFQEGRLESLQDEIVDLHNYECECLYSSSKNDLVVVIIKDIALGFLSVIDVFNGPFEESFAFGCPKSKQEIKANSKLQTFNCTDRRGGSDNIANYTFEVNTQDVLHTNDESDVDSVKGMSGGGVVVLGNDKKYHLVGIIKKSANFGNFEYTELSGILDIINKNISTDTQIQHYKNQAFIECKIDPDELDLDKIKQSILLSGNDIFQYRPSHNTDLEFIDSQNARVKNRFDKIRSAKNELSDYYVYAGIVHTENGEHGRATPAFKNAIELNGSNEHIFKQAYMGRKKYQKISNDRELKANTESLKKISKEEPGETQHIDKKDKIKNTLEEIINFHKENDLQNIAYFEEMDDSDKRELILQCRQYYDLNSSTFVTETSYFLSVLYSNFGMKEDAKDKCCEVLENFKKFPDKDKVLYAVKCQSILAIKLNQNTSVQDSIDCNSIARYGIPENHNSEHLIYHLLKIHNASFNHEYEQGRMDEATLDKIYEPLKYILSNYPETEKFEIEIEESHTEKLQRLLNPYSKYTKQDVIDELEESRAKARDLRAKYDRKMLENKILIVPKKTQELNDPSRITLVINKLVKRISGWLRM